MLFISEDVFFISEDVCSNWSCSLSVCLIIIVASHIQRIKWCTFFFLFFRRGVHSFLVVFLHSIAHDTSIYEYKKEMFYVGISS